VWHDATSWVIGFRRFETTGLFKTPRTGYGMTQHHITAAKMRTREHLQLLCLHFHVIIITCPDTDSHGRCALWAGVWICLTYSGRTGLRYLWVQCETNLGDLQTRSAQMAIQTGQSKNLELCKNVSSTYSQGGKKYFT